MKYKLYTVSGAAVAAMFSATEAAAHSIYWESYIFRNDTVPTQNFLELFIRKAREGVRVIIILDGFGSSDIAKKDVVALKAAGAEILFFSDWFRRMHRKLLVVDEQIAFFGGVNVGQSYVKWLDLHVRVQGKIVKTLVRTFAKSYALCGGKEKSLLLKQHLPDPVRRTKLWMLEHWPVLGRLSLKRHYEERIRQAKHHISIVSPYFIPHSWLIKLLKEAEGRGVSIDIVLPRTTDPYLGTLVNYLNALRFRSERMHFYFTKEMIHAKALLIDDVEGMIGSQNIDALSFDHNAEISAVFEHKSIVKDLVRIIKRWKEEAIPFEKLVWKKQWYHAPLTRILDLMHPIL